VQRKPDILLETERIPRKWQIHKLQ